MELIRTRAFFGFTFMLILLLSSCHKKDKTKIIKLGHALDISHPVHKAMMLMAKRLNEISNGKMQLEIYPSQQLGSERECLELLQIGSLGMTKVSTGALENFSPGMKIFGVPFLFKDKQHVYQVLDGKVGRELLNEGQKYWLKGLAYYDAGYRSFYTVNRPIEQPEDLKGLKIRVMESVSAMNLVRALGGSPTPISWGELYTALQQGVVDGAENNPPTFYFSHHYEVCKYYVLDKHTMMPDVLLISTIIWDKLSDQEKKWLQQAVDESVAYQRKIWKVAEKEALDAVKKAGVEVIRPDRATFAEKEKVKDLYKEYRKNPRYNKLINEIQAIGRGERQVHQ